VIYFANAGWNSLFLVVSDQYGDEGRKELEATYKKLNVKRTVFKDVGSPCNEKMIIPITKKNSLVSSGAEEITLFEISKIIKTKVDTWHQRMSILAANQSGKSPTQYTSAFDAEDEPIRHNRRDDDRRGSHKEKIRQERRNNNKRDYPDGKDSDDE
jgi:hypothetical protein